MANYLRPDVYVEDVPTGEKPIASTSTSVASFVGITARGEVNKAIQITSWTDFVRKFAKGLSTPFLRSSDLAQSVYGFYQNGGSVCYIVRVPVTGMAKASITHTDLIITAKDEGAWANDSLKVKIEANGDAFNVLVYMNEVLEESFEGVTNGLDTPKFFGEIINSQSDFIRIGEDQTLVVLPLTAMEGGEYDVATVKDNDFVTGLSALDVVPTVNLVAVPGKTTEAIVKAVVDYATEKKAFAVVDAPLDVETDVESLLAFRDKLKGNGAIYHPWGKIADPLSSNGSLRVCPPSGHIMGMYARTDSKRGVHKEPAGEEANLLGFVDLTAKVSATQIELLNPKGINCIIAKPNKGVVVWGARNLVGDEAKPYVSDMRYDLMVKQSLYDGTQWAVFEPNDGNLLERLSTSLTSFLDLQWRNGALLGETPEEAYYVKCDEELNDSVTRNKGILVAEIGYCKKKPAEFVVIRIVQKSN